MAPSAPYRKSHDLPFDLTRDHNGGRQHQPLDEKRSRDPAIYSLLSIDATQSKKSYLILLEIRMEGDSINLSVNAPATILAKSWPLIAGFCKLHGAQTQSKKVPNFKTLTVRSSTQVLKPKGVSYPLPLYGIEQRLRAHSKPLQEELSLLKRERQKELKSKMK